MIGPFSNLCMANPTPSDIPELLLTKPMLHLCYPGPSWAAFLSHYPQLLYGSYALWPTPSQVLYLSSPSPSTSVCPTHQLRAGPSVPYVRDLTQTITGTQINIRISSIRPNPVEISISAPSLHAMCSPTPLSLSRVFFLLPLTQVKFPAHLLSLKELEQ